MKFTPFIAALAAISLAAPLPVLAQPSDSTSAGKIPVARRLYEEGVEAVNRGRWSVARDRFKASYDLSPRVLTLFNLAGAQSQTNQFVEASESYRRFIRETADGRYAELRAEATSTLERLEAQIAQLTLALTNLDRSDAVTVDDVVFPQSALGEPFPMNPGEHVIAVRRGGATIATKTISLTAGAAESVSLTVPRKVDLQVRSVDGGTGVTGGSFGPPVQSEGGGGGVVRSPWFWTAIVVVVAGSAAGAYFLTRPEDDVLVVR